MSEQRRVSSFFHAVCVLELLACLLPVCSLVRGFSPIPACVPFSPCPLKIEPSLLILKWKEILTLILLCLCAFYALPCKIGGTAREQKEGENWWRNTEGREVIENSTQCSCKQ